MSNPLRARGCRPPGPNPTPPRLWSDNNLPSTLHRCTCKSALEASVLSTPARGTYLHSTRESSCWNPPRKEDRSIDSMGILCSWCHSDEKLPYRVLVFRSIIMTVRLLLGTTVASHFPSPLNASSQCCDRPPTGIRAIGICVVVVTLPFSSRLVSRSPFLSVPVANAPSSAKATQVPVTEFCASHFPREPQLNQSAETKLIHRTAIRSGYGVQSVAVCGWS